MVRLNPILESDILIDTGEFQFQHGAIKAVDIVFIVSLLSNFNSNMVRLKLFICYLISKLSCRFQFQHGAIKAFSTLKKIISLSDFNSNMVRLKQGRGSEGILRNVISIPTWCD